jgi:hypothetical protein
MTQMTYNALPVSNLAALGFHNQDGEGIRSTAWADLTSFFLEQAEQRFGPRDVRWFFCGITFIDHGPHLYFPANRPFHVGIQLSTSAASDPHRAYFQLAHEVAHLLGPNPSIQSATFLEEGMCTAFQIEMARAVGMEQFGDLGTYAEALALVRDLLATDPAAIRKLRELHKDLNEVNAEKLRRILPEVPEDTATWLTRPFPGGDDRPQD